MSLRDLAIEGGTPVRTAPMPRWPAPGPAEHEAVAGVLSSADLNYWAGTCGRELEREYAASLGRTHGIAVANGTLALELALRAFGIGPGDDVVVPSRTFIATASAVVAVGARPVLADVDPASGNLSVATLERALTPATRAVIPVHVGGWPVDMPPLLELARSHDLIVIEDCAQAHGATLSGRPAGSLGSHAAAFSFCQDKIISAGEGGLLVLDDDEAFERAWAYKDHGKALSKVRAASGPGTEFKWLHDSFGSNWRLSEISSALVGVGLRALPGWHTARTRNAHAIAEGAGGLPGISVPLPDGGAEHAFYRLYARIDSSALIDGWDRDRVVAAIAAEGAPCNYGTCALIGREAAFATLPGHTAAPLPVAEEFDRTQMAIPVHPALGPRETADIVAAVRKVLAAVAR